MGFRMFANQHSPIAIDFGSSSVKLLQIEPGDKTAAPAIAAVAELVLPDAARLDSNERLNSIERNLPATLKSGGFKGRRVVFSVPTSQAIVQHMQLSLADGIKRDDAVRSELQISMGLVPDAYVVRSHEVTEVNREGQTRTEVICFAIPRDLIMRHIALLEKCKLEVAGIHSQPSAVVRAFDHIHRREGDENLATMYIDLGYSCTCAAIAHGKDIVFARAIQVGGQHFDQMIAGALKCDLAGARAHRLSLKDPKASVAARPAAISQSARPQSQNTHDGEHSGGLARLTAAMAAAQEADDEATFSAATLTAEDRRRGLAAPVIAQNVEPGEGHTSAANVDFTELLETMTDELSMCLRYHRGLFPSRAIDRVVLLGGEARQNWLCRHVAKALRLPARLGDPLARFGVCADSTIDHSTPQPGWASVCGLCAYGSEK